MSDRIAVMMDGEILQCAAPEIVYEDPNDIRVAEFIGSPKINILPVERVGAELQLFGRSLDWRVPNEGPQIMQIGVRPEALRLTQTEPMLTGTVAHFENLGSEVFAQIALDQHAVRVTLRATPAERQMLGLGTQVGLRFDPAAALVFGSDGKRLRKVETSAHMISEVA